MSDSRSIQVFDLTDENIPIKLTVNPKQNSWDGVTTPLTLSITPATLNLDQARRLRTVLVMVIDEMRAYTDDRDNDDFAVSNLADTSVVAREGKAKQYALGSPEGKDISILVEETTFSIRTLHKMTLAEAQGFLSLLKRAIRAINRVSKK